MRLGTKEGELPGLVRVTLGIAALAALLSCNLARLAAPAPGPVTATTAATAAPDVATVPAPKSAPEPTVTPSPADWPVYRNDSLGFQLRYPTEGVLAIDEEATARIELPFTPGTNLSEKYLQIDASRGAAACASPLAAGWAPGSLATVSREIAGLTFTVQSGSEGAAGNFYGWIAYATARGDVCVSLSYVLHSTNAMSYTPPLAEFDAEAEQAVFDEITTTFTWTTP